MGKRTSYDHGTFCWADLGTTDAGDAKRFYTGLFEWEAEDLPDADGDGTAYTLFRVDGDRVAGMAETAADGQPQWDSFVCVEDIDDVAGRVQELGGELKQEPTAAGEHGRIAIAHDPAGQRFVLWEPGSDNGAERVNEPGCLCWNELLTPDPQRAAEFYAPLLGWSFTAIEAPPPAPEMMSIATSAGGRNGSTTKQDGDLTRLPAGWRPYFGAESCEQIAARAAELDGSVVFGPIEVPTGHLAILADPQGGVFGIVDGEMDP